MIDINSFRRQHNLPPSFGIGQFETKDYTGLASLDNSGDSLTTLRRAVFEAIPATLDASQLLDLVAQLSDVFSQELYAINDRIGLKAVEIDFAVSAFTDVCQSYAYATLQTKSMRLPSPAFETIYTGWLTSTTRISQTSHDYYHDGDVWKIHVLNTAYGRVGLAVTLPDGVTIYVRDARFGCPAEQFMYLLIAQVIANVGSALG